MRSRYQLIVKTPQAEEAYHQILQETPRILKLHIYSPGSVRSLLKKDGFTSNLADIDGYFLNIQERKLRQYLKPKEKNDTRL